MGVDIVILNKDKTDYLFKCLNSIIDNTSIDYHVYIGDTGSTSKNLKKIIKFCKRKFTKRNVSLIRYNYYHFGKNNNDVVFNHSKNDTILFCNNDIEFTDTCVDDLYTALTTAKNVGTVGCKLVFPNGNIQHAGQFAYTHKPTYEWPFEQDKLEVSHRGINEPDGDVFNTIEPVMGNTGAMLMINKQVFTKIKGFPEKYMECFEDVELNMRLKLAGYNNIYVGTTKATHHESVSRGKDRTALMKLTKDYINHLFPFWNKLTHNQQQLLTQ